MFTVSLCSKSSLQILTVRTFTTSIRQGHKLLSLRSNKSTSVLKRCYQTKTNAWRTWEAAERPKGITADATGRIILGGASVAGIAALCYYGLGLSNEIGAVDRASLWPKVVRERIQATYGYFAGSLVITAASAYGIARSRFIHRWMAASPLLTVGGGLIAMIGTSMLSAALPYEPGINAKHLAWIGHSSVVGLVIAPLMLLGGPLVVRAAACTAGVVASLSLTAACAPSDKFLSWGGPLALGLGGVFVASIGTLFLPATGAVGAGLQAIVTYGGLVIFGGFMLYDTQKIIKMAETYPVYGETVYDPIRASMGIYMDTINIFIRILIIMANSSGNRRK
ncbi:growth hormone-inducible transmembrane protein-like [Dendronephthya gigantea]|uniref:growth hormone-inducible transmembrane protein-like n=1 Tax=Dendronephthya gigantea TaxID=151771 RepID=UPI00106C24E7|nr:growth hormone-inducible transmembrane protein-like [Dendronephthya gigantea]